MIEALAIIGGGSSLVGLVAVVVLAFRLDGARKQQLAARDLLDGEREQHRKTRGELEVETATLVATRDELRKEKDLRASAESQRNDAYREARDEIVERIKKANVADAQRIIAGLLAAPLPGSLPKTLPEGRATAPGPDRLIDPGL